MRKIFAKLRSTACSSIKPTKLLICTVADGGRLYSAAMSAPILPGTRTTQLKPAARTTSSCTANEFLNASSDMGRKTPVVPIIDSPPSMPKSVLRVFLESSRPFSMPMVTQKPPALPVTSCNTLAIRRRGPKFIAGSPGGIDNPGLVILPTPSPARKIIRSAGIFCPRSSCGQSDVMTVAPSVMSGSSPECFMTFAVSVVPVR